MALRVTCITNDSMHKSATRTTPRIHVHLLESEKLVDVNELSINGPSAPSLCLLQCGHFGMKNVG